MTILLVLTALLAFACGGGGDDEDAAREILDANGVPTGIQCNGGDATVTNGGNAVGGNADCGVVGRDGNIEPAEDEDEEEEEDDDGGPGDDPLTPFQTPTPLGL